MDVHCSLCLLSGGAVVVAAAAGYYLVELEERFAAGVVEG